MSPDTRDEIIKVVQIAIAHKTDGRIKTSSIEFIACAVELMLHRDAPNKEAYADLTTLAFRIKAALAEMKENWLKLDYTVRGELVANCEFMADLVYEFFCPTLSDPTEWHALLAIADAKVATDASMQSIRIETYRTLVRATHHAVACKNNKCPRPTCAQYKFAAAHVSVCKGKCHLRDCRMMVACLSHFKRCKYGNECARCVDLLEQERIQTN
jgi:hypothetical protein